MSKWRHVVAVALAVSIAFAANLTTFTPAEALIHEIIAAACRAGGEEVVPPGQANDERNSFIRALQATGFITSVETTATQVIVHFDPTVPNSKFRSTGGDVVIPNGAGPGVALVLSPGIELDPTFPAHANCNNLNP
jgi:hypothetical protein